MRFDNIGVLPQAKLHAKAVETTASMPSKATAGFAAVLASFAGAIADLARGILGQWPEYKSALVP
jgi:hypothetical protein